MSKPKYQSELERGSKLKLAIMRKINAIMVEINKLEEFIAKGQNVDYKVCYTRLSELQQRLQDINDIDAVCVERNRY